MPQTASLSPFSALLLNNSCLLGQTVIFPAGCIHAAFTAKHSISIGGSLLNTYAIKTQWEVYEMECRLETHEDYRYPDFVAANWHAAHKIIRNFHKGKVLFQLRRSLCLC